MRIRVSQPAPLPPARDLTRVAVVLPAYNEELHIEEVVRRALAAGVGRVFCVDDCSGDSTGAILERLAGEARVEVCSHEVNRGKQAAVRTGLRAALRDRRAALFALLDADMQNDPVMLPRLAPHAEGCDTVIGVRERAGMPPHRRLANALACLPYRLLAGVAVSDVQSGFRIYTRPVAAHLAEHLCERGRYTLEHRSMLQFGEMSRLWGRPFRIAEVPIPCSYSGASSSIRLKDNVQLTWATIYHALALARLRT